MKRRNEEMEWQRFPMRIGRPLLLAAALLCLWRAAPAQNFAAQELLGRVTDSSVTINMAADQDLDAYVEYGIASGAYASRTATARYSSGTPFNIALTGLKANTRYYYRVQYRAAGASAFVARAEHSFQTQRPRGSTFTFDIQFDPHMDENSDAATYTQTLANILADKPDFLIDLGDNSMSDKLQPVTQSGVLARNQLLRTYYDLACHSVPLFLVLGNHEGEWGRFLDGTPNNVAVWNTLARKQYYPNPVPDSFFSGDSQAYPLVGQRQAYYSWEWGDALFVVLDPYWNLPVAPDASGDWSLTLGPAQYAWLKRTLENSAATFKFVFCHNLVGGLNMNGPMRGGIETVKYLEWGGYNLDGTWGFDKARPDFAMPIHNLLVANNVTVFFHGHDHLYAKQDLDGIVYQEGPQPSARNTSLGTRGTAYAYTHGTVLGGVGYIRVTVSPTAVAAQYVQTWVNETATQRNGMVADSYTIPARKPTLKAISAAGYAGGTVAPESIVAAYGDSIGSGPVLVTDSAGERRRADVLGAAPAQVVFVVPAGTAAGRAQIDTTGASGAVLVDPVAPGVFTANADGQGVAAAFSVTVTSDGKQETQIIFDPATPIGLRTALPIDVNQPGQQVYLTLFGTGMRNFADQATATIGGVPVPVADPFGQAQFQGLDQVNLGPLPSTLSGRGEIAVELSVDGRTSNRVTVSIR
jgi:uncharacterized protein (TIGR03437 family)